MRNNDILGRILGVLIIVVGVVMLYLVFQYALEMFTSDTMGLRVPEGKAAAGAALNALGVSTVLLFARIALLFLMAIIGSMVTSKGISLMFASRAAVQPREPEA